MPQDHNRCRWRHCYFSQHSSDGMERTGCLLGCELLLGWRRRQLTITAGSEGSSFQVITHRIQMASNPLQIPSCSTSRGTQTPPASPCSLLREAVGRVQGRVSRSISVPATPAHLSCISLQVASQKDGPLLPAVFAGCSSACFLISPLNA